MEVRPLSLWEVAESRMSLPSDYHIPRDGAHLITPLLGLLWCMRLLGMRSEFVARFRTLVVRSRVSYAASRTMRPLNRYAYAISRSRRVKRIASAQWLAALFHFRADIADDRLRKSLRPLVQIRSDGLLGFRFLRQHLLTERRFVERGEVLQLLLGEIGGIHLGHLLADFLLAAGHGLGLGERDLVEVLLIAQIVRQQLILDALNDVGDRIGKNLSKGPRRHQIFR